VTGFIRQIRGELDETSRAYRHSVAGAGKACGSFCFAWQPCSRNRCMSDLFAKGIFGGKGKEPEG